MEYYKFNIKLFCDYNLVMCILFLIMFMNICVEASQEPSLTSFNKRNTFRPTVIHTRTKREISSTLNKEGEHHAEITMIVTVDDEEQVLDLRLNHDLIPNNHVLKYYRGGEPVIHKMNKKDIELCEYGGTVRHKPGSWVALSTCRGVSGVVFDGLKARYIEPSAGADILTDHFIYEDVDINSNNASTPEESITHLNRYKRSAIDSTFLESHYYAESKELLYVELALVVTHEFYNMRRRNLHVVHQDLKEVVNIINSIYSPLNVVIALVGVEVWSEGDKIAVDHRMRITLDSFLSYRKETLYKSIPNDDAHLLGAHSEFENDNVLGLGMTGGMCSQEMSGGISKYQISDTKVKMASILAHEIGHNFNMNHDEASCRCPDRACIMSAYSGRVSHWSSCSVDAFHSAINRIGRCLKNKPERLIGPICGNGFTEEGEQCDCGLSTTEENKQCLACCDQATCKLRPNAVCAGGRCCDLRTCGLKPRGVECRSASNQCDLAEYCTGDSEFCPDDVYKMDTTPCGFGENATCFGGQCGSRTDKCRKVMKDPHGYSSSDILYNRNTRGSVFGHCGRDYTTRDHLLKPCGARDVMCGALHCSTRDGQSRVFSVDTGPNDENPSLVPDGASCGDGMICQKQRCVAISSVLESLTWNHKACPTNCSGHGTCDSRGQCHCDSGFVPPLCLRDETSDGQRRQEYTPPKSNRPVYTPSEPNKTVYTPPRSKIPVNAPSRPNIPVYNPPKPNIPDYTPPRPNIPVNSPPRPKITVYTSPKPNIPVYTPPKPNIPVYTPPRPNIPVYRPPRPNIPDYTPPRPNIPDYNPPRPNIPDFTPPRPNIPDYRPPRPNIPDYTPPRPNIPDHNPPRPNIPVYTPPKLNRPSYPSNKPIDYYQPTERSDNGNYSSEKSSDKCMMYVIFLCIIPLILLILLLICYYFRQNLLDRYRIFQISFKLSKEKSPTHNESNTNKLYDNIKITFIRNKTDVKEINNQANAKENDAIANKSVQNTRPIKKQVEMPTKEINVKVNDNHGQLCKQVKDTRIEIVGPMKSSPHVRPIKSNNINIKVPINNKDTVQLHKTSVKPIEINNRLANNVNNSNRHLSRDIREKNVNTYNVPNNISVKNGNGVNKNSVNTVKNKPEISVKKKVLMRPTVPPPPPKQSHFQKNLVTRNVSRNLLINH